MTMSTWRYAYTALPYSNPNELPISIYTVESAGQTLEIRVSEQTSELLSVQLSTHRADDSASLVDLSEARKQVANGVRSTKPLVVTTMDLHENVMTSATVRTYAPSSTTTPGVLSVEKPSRTG